MIPQTTNGTAGTGGNAPRVPRGVPIAGHIPQWRKDPVRLLTDAARQADVVRLQLPGATYLVSHPSHVKHVLQDNNQNYIKGWVFNRIRPYWGQSLLTAEGEVWRQQRRRVQPSFKREHTTGFAPIVTARTAEMLARWEKTASDRGELSLYNEMTELALVIIGDILFGVDLWTDAKAMARAAQSALAVLKKRVAALAPLPLWVPTTDNRRFNNAMHLLHHRISEIVERKRQSEDPGETFLAMLMAARDTDTGAPMSDTQLHEEILGMLQQGHDTVGEALAWTWYLLSLHPEIEHKLHLEVAHAIGDRVPTVADLPRLQYAHMILQESLRLYPPVWVIPRDAIKDDEIGGCRIPAKSTILLSPYITHRHPDFWENPEAFDPDRFLPARSHDRPRHAYFPFGGGPRLCMGVDMAMMEMMLIMVMVVQRFRLHLVSCHREEPECILDMIPRNRVRATLQRQQPIAGPSLAEAVGAPAKCPVHAETGDPFSAAL
jgi:cytochrome P450